MSKSVIFIPRSFFLDSDRVMPTLGPLYLKTFLESRGHGIVIEDSPAKANLDRFRDCDVLSISCTTPQYYEAGGGKDLAETLRSRYPEKKLIIGGAHASYYYQELLAEGLFDHIVRGDGEKAFLKILEGEKLPQLVSYPKLTEEEMNSFPIPWRDQDYLSKYRYQIGGVDSTTAITGKNCPMGCKYCENRHSGLALFTPEHVDKEMSSIKDAGFRGVMFFDDIFILNEKRTRELCGILQPHDLIFRCFGHAKLLSRSREVINLLSEVGCREIGFGAESGDQGILDTVDKGNKIEEVYAATENVLACGLNISAFLMIGLPGESRETIANTERYIARFSKNPNFHFDYAPFFPYRGTYIREHINEFDLKLNLDGNIGYYKGAEGSGEYCVSTSKLSREEIKKERERIIKTYRNNFKGTKK